MPTAALAEHQRRPGRSAAGAEPHELLTDLTPDAIDDLVELAGADARLAAGDDRGAPARRGAGRVRRARSARWPTPAARFSLNAIGITAEPGAGGRRPVPPARSLAERMAPARHRRHLSSTSSTSTVRPPSGSAPRTQPADSAPADRSPARLRPGRRLPLQPEHPPTPPTEETRHEHQPHHPDRPAHRRSVTAACDRHGPPSGLVRAAGPQPAGPPSARYDRRRLADPASRSAWSASTPSSSPAPTSTDAGRVRARVDRRRGCGRRRPHGQAVRPRGGARLAGRVLGLARADRAAPGRVRGARRRAPSRFLDGESARRSSSPSAPPACCSVPAADATGGHDRSGRRGRGGCGRR